MSFRDDISQQQQALRDQSLWRKRLTLESPQSTHVNVDGQKLLNFSSNDYLGLANHPDVRAAAIAAIEKWGVGAGASHLICGHQQPHEDLEQRLASFVGAERAVLFSTGYMANLAIPQAFLGRDDLLLQDKLNHASLIDAAMLCRAKLRRYQHGNAAHVMQIVTTSGEGKTMLATDGVFSMNGATAPLIELARFCQSNDVILVVDDAHGFGVLGPEGRGALAATKIPIAGNVLMVGTLSKAIGAAGAFVAGDELLIEQIIQKSRSYIYTTALPSSIAAAASKSLDIIESEPTYQQQLVNNLNRFRQAVKSNNIDVLHSVTPIQSMVFGDATAAIDAAKFMREKNILAIAIRPPTVPEGTSRLRITITAAHTSEEIDQLVAALATREIRNLARKSDQ